MFLNPVNLCLLVGERKSLAFKVVVEMCVLISHQADEFSWRCIFSDVLCFNNYSFVFPPQLPHYALYSLHPSVELPVFFRFVWGI